VAAAGLDPTGPERAAIEGHLRLLLAWTGSVNLTAIRDPSAAVRLHVADSLAALPLLRARGATRLLDLGSGGGYPGLPLAIALPAAALLVDSIGKKTRFLDTAVAAIGLAGRVAVATARAETLAADRVHRERWPVVTVRAVARLDELVELAFPLLAVGGVLVAWKRGDLAGELAAARRAADALGGGAIVAERVAVAGLDDHRLVVVEKGGPTAPGWPRDPALRARHPW
jgi:16S rRNA (guanine527-N7)-methyltransferase